VGYLRGTVSKVIHTTGTYNVFSFRIEAQSYFSAPGETKVSGHLFGITSLNFGSCMELTGEWVNHKKYGKQFRVTGWKPWARTTYDIAHFLDRCVGVFHGQDLVKRVVDAFGLDTYEALMGDKPLALATNEQETEELSGAIQKWKLVRNLATLSDFLQEYDLGASLIAAVFDRFGFEAVEILSENPYRLVEIDGVSFQRADTIASHRGIDSNDPRRIAAAVVFVIRDSRLQGHLYLRRGDIPTLLSDMLKSSGAEPFQIDLGEAVANALDDLEANGAVKVDPGVGVYTHDMYRYERSSGVMLSNFLTPSNLILDMDLFLRDYETAHSLTLSDQQREAVIKLIDNRVLVVTGAPGTGKTTLIRTFVHMFRALGISHMLMAPTGIAAKRLAHVTESAASTIHRALRYDGFQWGVGGDVKLTASAVIVDELSMVDMELFYRLLDSLEPTTMLVLVGDDAQLPSVGAGNVLRELIACDNVPTVKLEHVFRQAETSDIVLAAHQIRRGKSPLGLPRKPDGTTEFEFLQISNEELIADLVVKMAVKLKARDANFQVLSPKYEGAVGVDKLNTLLRDALNENTGQPSCDLLSLNVRVGDRLMVVKNDYKLNVYNGDIGKLVEIQRDVLMVKIHGIGKAPDVTVAIPRDQASIMLKLAYCVTVHKSQGEEFETVILPLVRSQGRMLQRNLFYTAVTRARKKVWLLGETDAVLKAVANDKVLQRNTVLRKLIAPLEVGVKTTG
jgi:exodeoxyribonuclease V alpha subunit